MVRLDTLWEKHKASKEENKEIDFSEEIKKEFPVTIIKPNQDLTKEFKKQIELKLLSLPKEKKQFYVNSFVFENEKEYAEGNEEWINNWKNKKFNDIKLNITDIKARLYELSKLSPLELSEEVKELEKQSNYSASDIKKELRNYISERNSINKNNRKEKNEQIKETNLFVSGKEKIQLPGDDSLISVFADKLGERLEKTNDLFFRKDIGECVEIENNNFKILKPASFVTLVEDYFQPWTIKMGNYGKFEIDKSMNQQTANIVLCSKNFQQKIKPIKRIFNVPLPILHEGVLTFPKVGYDERFNSWLSPGSPTIDENIPIEKAKEIISKIYGEFCFQTVQYKTNAIAGLLTPFLRGIYSSWNVRSPLFCYLANRERAGKDYCAGITGIVLEGESIEESPISTGEIHGNSNDELRKKILSAIIMGRKRLHFANNKGKINNAVFEAYLTNRIFSGRLLGKNEMKQLDNEMDNSLSGNLGLTMSPDLSNRSRHIRLFLDIEDANERVFKIQDLHGWVLKNRDLILSSIYSLIKNWFNKGMPKSSIPFTSYPEWSEICGGIMECAGLGNPCVKDTSTSISLDEETDEMKNFFEYIYENVGEKEVDARQIKILLNKNDDLFPTIDWDKRADQIKFGKKLGLYVGRILSDIKLLSDNNKRTARRKYQFILQKSSYNPQKSGNVVIECNKYSTGEYGYSA